MSTQKQKLEKLSRRYHSQFLSPPDDGSEIVTAGRGYLAAHGIDTRAIVEKYRLGVVIDPAPGDERFAGMLSIPYLSPRGGVKVIKYRRLFGEGSKLAQYTGQPARLFNTKAWFTEGTAVGLTEGEADAICATERLGLPSMAIPGAEVWAAHERVWRLCFRDVRVVFVLCDGDSPGRELGRQVASSLGWRASVIDLPDGEDVSSLVASGHSDWFDGKLIFTDDDEDELHMQILSVDVETRPNIVYKWDLFDKSTTPNEFIVEPSRVICFAAKWVGDRAEPQFWSEFRDGRETMLEMAHSLFCEADVLLHYNGQSFDEPKLNAEFIQLGFNPPSPYRRIDLYRAVRSRFAFPSGKLNYVCQALEVGQKTKHEGIDLWRRCMAGDAAAWTLMETYNKQDVALNEDLYYAILPWIPGLPSYGATIGGDVCPGCGSEDLRREGFAYTKTGRYQRFMCRECGTWSRASRRETGTGIVQVSA